MTGRRCVLLGWLVTLACGRHGAQPPEPQRVPVAAPVRPAVAAQALREQTAVALAATASAPEVAVQAAATPATAGGEGPATTGDALLWRANDLGEETLWIQTSRGQAPVVAARRPGLWLALGDDLWGLRHVQRRLAVCDPQRCAQDDSVCVRVPPRLSSAWTEDLMLVGLRSLRQMPLPPRLPDTTAVGLAASDFARTIEPLTLSDGRLTLRLLMRYMPCGGTVERQQTAYVLLRLPSGLAEALTEEQALAERAPTDLAELDGQAAPEEERRAGVTWLVAAQPARDALLRAFRASRAGP